MQRLWLWLTDFDWTPWLCLQVILAHRSSAAAPVPQLAAQPAEVEDEVELRSPEKETDSWLGQSMESESVVSQFHHDSWWLSTSIYFIVCLIGWCQEMVANSDPGLVDPLEANWSEPRANQTDIFNSTDSTVSSTSIIFNMFIVDVSFPSFQMPKSKRHSKNLHCYRVTKTLTLIRQFHCMA